MSMEVTGKMFCKPCGDGTKRVPANGLCRDCEEHMCIACFGNHKKYKICKDHRLVDIDTKVLDISEATEEKFENCLKHKNEKIKFYCSSHEEVGCGDCTILEHKTCNVEYIRDVSKTFKESKEFQDIVKDVDSCQKEVTKFYTSFTDNKVQVEDIYQGFLADIKSFRDEINIRLDKLEEELVQKAKDAKTTDTLLIESLETSCEDLKKELSQISDELVSRTDEPNTLFVTAMR
ncbi:transcription intermediary factor 1-alpha-like [Mercenaria mercenaria]|uniref:transcription intermediary factor 1-alpha-like n=1 Tax=Mercenaria mercenaria TaxID=6596 RepID=UPI00234F4712|nr:transcription intermediary factor 1-alpha-like [Mercenaria mercenaria]